MTVDDESYCQLGLKTMLCRFIDFPKRVDQAMSGEEALEVL